MTLAEQHVPAARSSLIQKLNGPWHLYALLGYLAIVIGHWVEHLTQAYQVYGLHWHRPAAGGALGLAFPWLVSSEWLHYGYALAMVIGLALLRPGFVGRGRLWWTISLGIQIWHHFEHLLLLVQKLSGVNFFGAQVPTSILQLFFPRMELHLFYNAIVFVPMIIAMVYHRFPSSEEREQFVCSCAMHKKHSYSVA